MADEAKVIKHISAGGENYDLYAASADYVPWSGVSGLTGTIDTSTQTGFASPSAVAQAIAEATSSFSPSAIGDLKWSNISGLEKTSAEMTATTGIMTPAQIAAAYTSAINAKVSGVYRVKGTKTVAEINALTDMEVGDVWDVADSGIINGQSVEAGDNVVYTSDKGWDKLAASVDLSNYVTKDDLSAATSSNMPSLWSEVTSYVDETVSAATAAINTSASLWNATYEVVSANSALWNATEEEVSTNSGNWNSVYETVSSYSADWDAAWATVSSTVDTSAGIADSSKAGELVQAGAVSSYVADKLAGLTGDYLEKKDIYVNGDTLVVDNKTESV